MRSIAQTTHNRSDLGRAERFAQCSAAALRRIDQAGTTLRVSAGQRVIPAGRTHWIVTVLEGQLEVADALPRRINAGETWGVEEAITGNRNNELRACENSRIHVIGVREFGALVPSVVADGAVTTP